MPEGRRLRAGTRHLERYQSPLRQLEKFLQGNKVRSAVPSPDLVQKYTAQAGPRLGVTAEQTAKYPIRSGEGGHSMGWPTTCRSIQTRTREPRHLNQTW